jgi:hypothetical protein
MIGGEGSEGGMAEIERVFHIVEPRPEMVPI